MGNRSQSCSMSVGLTFIERATRSIYCLRRRNEKRAKRRRLLLRLLLLLMSLLPGEEGIMLLHSHFARRKSSRYLVPWMYFKFKAAAVNRKHLICPSTCSSICCYGLSFINEKTRMNALFNAQASLNWHDETNHMMKKHSISISHLKEIPRI